MDPKITNISEDSDGSLKFTLSGVNVSLANAVRRIITSEIPTVVFRTTPYEENKAVIDINTSRLNNEIIKQRLSCIPIHITDPEFPIKEHIMEVDVKNDTDVKEIGSERNFKNRIVTSEDFKIKNIATGKYLSREAVRAIFPPDPITGDYIDFVRLRPKISDEIDGEHLKMTCEFDYGTAKQDGTFNVASCCAYGNTRDERQIQRAWIEKERELRSKKMSDEEIEFAKNDWLVLDANRYFIPDSFDFTIETVGVYRNVDLVKMACKIMIDKLNKFKETINTRGELISLINHKTTFEKGFDIILENEDYTLGKVVEYLIYTNYYEGRRNLDFCGFRKPHPHIPVSIIRISFKGSFYPDDEGAIAKTTRNVRGGAREAESESDNAQNHIEAHRAYATRMINQVCDQAIGIYENIQRVF